MLSPSRKDSEKESSLRSTRESESRHRGDSFRSSSVIDTPEAMKAIKDTGVLSVSISREREGERERENEERD